jgi:leucyl-tRNA synthetase
VGTLDPDRLGPDAQDLRRKAHETLARADDDYGRRIQFNTVVSAVHELVNQASRTAASDGNERAAVREALRIALIVLSPIAPHATQALWTALGEPGLLVQASWPEVDESALVQDRIELVVQVNGKVRGHVEVPADVDQEAALAAARGAENVARFVEDKTIRKVILVPGKLLNIVVG